MSNGLSSISSPLSMPNVKLSSKDSLKEVQEQDESKVESKGVEEISQESSQAFVAQGQSFVVKQQQPTILDELLDSISRDDNLFAEDKAKFVNNAKACCSLFKDNKEIENINKILKISNFLLYKGLVDDDDETFMSILKDEITLIREICSNTGAKVKEEDANTILNELLTIERKLKPESLDHIFGDFLKKINESDNDLKNLDAFKELEKNYKNRQLQYLCDRISSILDKKELTDVDKNTLKKHFEKFCGDDTMENNLKVLKLLEKAIDKGVINTSPTFGSTSDCNAIILGFMDKLLNTNGIISHVVVSEFIKNCQGKEFLNDDQSKKHIENLKQEIIEHNKKIYEKCLNSDQYLMMQKMLINNDLSQYTSFELNIINGMFSSDKIPSNPPIEQSLKQKIIREIFKEEILCVEPFDEEDPTLEESYAEMMNEITDGETFDGEIFDGEIFDGETLDEYFYIMDDDICKLEKEVNALPEKEKQEKLESINIDLRNELKSNGCAEKINCLHQVMEMFDNVYKNEIMKGDGLKDLAQHRAVELCFAKPDSKKTNGFSNAKFNIVSIMSNNPTWENLEAIISDQDKAHALKSTMRHELTHYTQGFLSYCLIENKEELSDQAKKAAELFSQPYVNPRKAYDKYVLHPMEMGARTTEILSQLEETCGLEYGEFCFQEEGRYDKKHKDREEHAKKIVDKLDEYLQKREGRTLAQFLNRQTISPDGTTRHGFSRLLDLFTFDVHDKNGIAVMIKEDTKLQLSSKQLTSDKANEKIAKCFEYLLEYIIPRADMKLIAEKLGSKDNTFIEEEKQIINPAVLDEQIEACASQIQLYEALLEKMQMQDSIICMPSIDDLSSQIEELEKNIDVIEYKQFKTKLEEAQASNEDTKELLEKVDQYSTLPIVSSYIYLNQLKNHSTLIDLQNQLKNINLDNPQEAKEEIESIKAQMLALRPDYQQYIEDQFKSISENLDELEKYVKLVEIKKQVSSLISDYYQYELERNANGNLDSKTISAIFEKIFEKYAEKFQDLVTKLGNLPKGIQSQLNHYLNWANRGLAKFQDWRNGLTK